MTFKFLPGVAIVLSVMALAGCATDNKVSYVDGVQASDAPYLARSITEFVSQELPPAATTLAIQPPQESQSGNALTPALHQQLASAGFGIASPDQHVPGAHTLRYLVSPLSGGLLVRLNFDMTQANRWYVRNSAGQLQPGSPFTVNGGK